MTNTMKLARKPAWTAPQSAVPFSNIISALSYALDLTEGACPGHSVGTCILGMRIALHMRLPDELLNDLYYALLLKDVGCSNNASRLFQIIGDDEQRAKRFTREDDWTNFSWKQIRYVLRHVHAKEHVLKRMLQISRIVRNGSKNAEELIRLRCSKGADVVRSLGLGTACAGAIYCLDEHWNGAGYPDRLAGQEIPLLARIVSVAQTLDVFRRSFGDVAALDIVLTRNGKWFDPMIVRAVLSLYKAGGLWQDLRNHQDLLPIARALEPHGRSVDADAFTIDNICLAFAGVVDAKSHYTYTHSTGVTELAVGIAEQMQMTPQQVKTLRRASLLHDVGKLSVPNSILDKEGKLDEGEWDVIKRHPHYTFEILNRIAGFTEIAEIAASHHEKLDGSGYHRGLTDEGLGLPSRILTVADMYDAMTGDRPYRASPLSTDAALTILRKLSPYAVDVRCVDALESFVSVPTKQTLFNNR